jgi:hypothetical protein
VHGRGVRAGRRRLRAASTPHTLTMYYEDRININN